jgi:hypothetical protein
MKIWNGVHAGLLAAAVLAVTGWAAPAMAADEQAADEQNLVELELDLPEPSFGGTPLAYFGPNLEEPSFKPREAFMVPEGAANVARGKPVTSSVARPIRGELKYITDGDKSYEDENLVELNPGLQWVQIDLGEPHAIYAILVWHYHAAERVYFDVVVRVSNDAEFTDNVQTVYNNDHDNSSGLGAGKDKEYVENYEGRLIDAKGAAGRYVRLYSNGNTSDETNHYVEVEVYGKPAE